jgi:hypothetical protein
MKYPLEWMVHFKVIQLCLRTVYTSRLTVFRRGVWGLLLGLMIPTQAWEGFVALSEGYTRYDAQDLNRVLFLLEKTTQEQGFNNYDVSHFDGHPQAALTLGLRHRGWQIGVEAEFWVETFVQSEVPFDLDNAERSFRVTCADLRDPNYTGGGFYGCVQAKEKFNFLPITLQVSRVFTPFSKVEISPGYGVGIMAGSAHINLKTDYFGEGAIPNDEIRFSIWPGINSVQKLFTDVEWRPWRPIGLGLRAGYRWSKLDKGFALKDQKGQSRIFSTVFPDAEEGAILYIQEGTTEADQYLYLGPEAKARRLATTTGDDMHLIVGDFTGWFVALRLVGHW